MSNKLSAILKTNGNESTLLLWLDYHKHIFDSGIVVIQNDQSGPNIKTQIRRILSGSENDERLNDKWQIIETQSYPISSSRYSENGFDLLLTPYEFLLDTNKANIMEHCKYHELYKINYQLREDDDVILPL